MGILRGWRNSRAVRRFKRLDDRWLAAMRLWRTGRFTEYAEEMAQLVTGYDRETRVVDRVPTMVNVSSWRCAALVRAGRPAEAEAEAARLSELLRGLEGEDGPYRRELRAILDAAYRGEEPDWLV